MKSLFFTITTAIFFSGSLLSQTIEYSLGMPEPHTHYFEVGITVSDVKQEYIDFKMPVWTPGSYLVREFGKSVEAFDAKGGKGNDLEFELIDKNTWRVYTNSVSPVSVSYKVYAFEMSVRTSFLDASHGYLNGTSVFMYIAGMKEKPVQLVINPYKEWSKISTALEAADKSENTFKAPDYDVLVDAPIEIGNHKEFTFSASGVNHRVAIYGDGNYNEENLKEDMALIVEECTNVFGVNPNKEYLFIIHNLTQGSGGLEHLNSTTLQVNRWGYQPESAYKRFLSLVAHEYFHLWNVKRIRPITLGPFNYDQENYTRLLWVMEGFTSYYDELLLKRAGLYSEQRYLNVVAGTISRVENQPGNKVQPVAESSFHAWIKAYRPNENSPNTTISYYSKGAVVATLLDLEIMNQSKGKKNLDDVMQYLYNEYYKKQNRGFTDEEMQKAVEMAVGKKMDDFFKKYVNGTEMPDYEKYFNYAGCEFVDIGKAESNVSFGVRTTNSGGKLVVQNVYRGSGAYDSGINANDEIIAVDGWRVGDNDFEELIAMHKDGEKVKVQISRDGILKEIEVTLKATQRYRFQLVKKDGVSADQNAVYNRWMGKK